MGNAWADWVVRNIDSDNPGVHPSLNLIVQPLEERLLRSDLHDWPLIHRPLDSYLLRIDPREWPTKEKQSDILKFRYKRYVNAVGKACTKTFRPKTYLYNHVRRMTS